MRGPLPRNLDAVRPGARRAVYPAEGGKARAGQIDAVPRALKDGGMETKERRERLYLLDERTFLYCLTAMAKWPEHVMLPVIQDLPDNAVVERIRFDFERRAFVAAVSHPTFDVVPPGALPPLQYPIYTTVARRDYARATPVEMRIHGDSVELFGGGGGSALPDIDKEGRATRDIQAGEVGSAHPDGISHIYRGHQLQIDPRITRRDVVPVFSKDGARIGTSTTIHLNDGEALDETIQVKLTNSPEFTEASADGYARAIDPIPKQDDEHWYNAPDIHEVLKLLGFDFRELAASVIHRHGPKEDIDPQSLRYCHFGPPGAIGSAMLGIAYKWRPQVVKVGDLVQCGGLTASALPAEVIEREEVRPYSDTEAQAEFFRKSIMNE